MEGDKKMKKLVLILCVLFILTSVFAGAVFADPDNDSQQSKEDREVEKAEREAEREAAKAEREAAKAAREAEKEQWKAEFDANKLARKELQEATKAQIAEQREIVKEYKTQLQAFMQEIEGLPEEERALYEDQINELRQQFKDAQGYVLQIRHDGLQTKHVLSPSYVTPAQQPVPEVETVEEVVDVVLEDLT